MTGPIWEQRYAMEMIEKGAQLLGARVEFRQDMDLESIKTHTIVITLIEGYEDEG